MTDMTMKLWLLEARRDLPETDDPWKPWYDKNFGLVVRALTEEQARELAQQGAANESRNAKKPWLHASYSRCEELTVDGDEAVVLIDHRSA